MLIILSLLVILGLLGGGIFLYARYIEPNLITVNRLSIQSDTDVLPNKIVFFSDTHFGSLYEQEKVENIVDKINQEEADLVIFGGDLFDSYAKDKTVLDLDYLSQQFKKIEAKYGKFAIWGNHDYGGGASKIYEEFLTAGGFTILQNQSFQIDELNMNLTGLDDYLFGTPEVETKNLAATTFNLFVSHAPDIIDEIDLAEIDLMFAGHSHGGQVSLPWITSKILPVGAENYVKGIYDFVSPKQTKLFVSKGLGVTKLPYRFLNTPEIVVVKINY